MYPLYLLILKLNTRGPETFYRREVWWIESIDVTGETTVRDKGIGVAPSQPVKKGS